MSNSRGQFVISLDFELHWGMFDKVTLAEYGDNISGVKDAIPAILDLFKEYKLHATWATVGMLMYEDKTTLLNALPKKPFQPQYNDMRVSSYEHLKTDDIGQTEKDDPYHFGATLVRQIVNTPNQELGSHTFSHYYCIDGSKNSEAIFTADCIAMKVAAKPYGITPSSLVFPRNQWTEKALETAKEEGIETYRGTERHFLYKTRPESKQTFLIRGLRLLDAYLNFSGHHTHTITTVNRSNTDSTVPINIPSSRFLRPWSRRLSFLEPLRLRRIKRAMTNAAKCGEVFHLWWHPHNFGTNLEKNMDVLKEITEHYRWLSEKYGMKSMNMKEAAILANE